MPGPARTQSALQRMPTSHCVTRTPSRGAIVKTRSAAKASGATPRTRRVPITRPSRIGSQSVAAASWKKMTTVERLVERRRLAVERPLQHRDDDRRHARGRTASARRDGRRARTASPSGRRRSARATLLVTAAFRNRCKRCSRQIAEREVLRGEQQRGTDTAASMATKMRRRRRASQASARTDAEGGRGRPRRGARRDRRQRQRRAEAMLHAGEHGAAIAPEDERRDERASSA